MTPMTPRQAEVLRFIIDFRFLNGYSPTVREIARAIHATQRTSGIIVRELEEIGAISRPCKYEYNWNRSIVPVAKRVKEESEFLK